MKDNQLTYDLRSNGKGNTIDYYRSHNYEIRLHSPTNNLKNNIAKIDEELLHLKQKIKTVRNTPSHSLSKISFQYASSTSKTEDSFHLAMAKLVNELKEKETIIENMLGDIQLMENRMMSYQTANEDLTRQLDNEIRSRLEMEAQLKAMIERMSNLSHLEDENRRLKEDNIRMYKLLEEMKQSKDYEYKEYYPIEKQRRKYDGNECYNDKWIDLDNNDNDNDNNGDKKYGRANSSNVFAKRMAKHSRNNEDPKDYSTLLNATENVIYNKPRRMLRNDNNHYNPTNKTFDEKNKRNKGHYDRHYVDTYDDNINNERDNYPLESEKQNGSNIKDLYNKCNQPETDEENPLCKSCQCYPKKEFNKVDNSIYSYTKNLKDDSYISPIDIKDTDINTDDYFMTQSNEPKIVQKKYNANQRPFDSEREFANSKPKTKASKAMKNSQIKQPQQEEYQMQQDKGNNCLGLHRNHQEKPWIAFKPEKDNNHFETEIEPREEEDNVEEEEIKPTIIKANTARHPTNTKSRSYDFRNNNPKNKPITEEEEYSNNNKHYHPKQIQQQQQLPKKYIACPNNYIKVDEVIKNDYPQQKPLKQNKKIKDKLNNIKEQINNIQQQSKPNNPNNNDSNLHPSQYEISIDEINRNQSNNNNSLNNSSNLKKSKEYDTNHRYEPVDTNLDTLQGEERPSNSLNMTSSKDKIITLLDKVNQLTETVTQNKEEVKSKQNYIDTIEQENKLLKDKLNEQKNQMTLIKEQQEQLPTVAAAVTSPTISPNTGLTQQQVNQVSYSSLPSFFNQPIIREKIIMKTKNNLNNSTTSGGNVFSKLKLNTSLDDSYSKYKVQLSDNIILKPYDKKRLLCFDISNYKFGLIDFIDYSNYDSNYGKGGIIYLNHSDGLYIITGENSDCLYNYTHSTKSMTKLCNLNNNHAMGGFVQYTKNSTGEQCLICISGWYNKKVEEYSIKKNEWSALPEVLVERGEAAYLVCDNQRLYAFFGYNCPQKKYLNTIEYCSLNSSTNEDYKWKSIKYQYQSEPFSLYIKSHSLVSINQSHFVILGGFDGKDNQPIDSFIEMTIDDNNNGKEQVSFSKVNRKLFGIDKNHLYNFNCDFTMLSNSKGMSYQVCYDEADRVHVINLNSMSHDIFYFD